MIFFDIKNIIDGFAKMCENSDIKDIKVSVNHPNTPALAYVQYDREGKKYIIFDLNRAGLCGTPNLFDTIYSYKTFKDFDVFIGSKEWRHLSCYIIHGKDVMPIKNINLIITTDRSKKSVADIIISA